MAALNKTDAGPSCRLPSPFSLFFFSFSFHRKGAAGGSDAGRCEAPGKVSAGKRRSASTDATWEGGKEGGRRPREAERMKGGKGLREAPAPASRPAEHGNGRRTAHPGPAAARVRCPLPPSPGPARSLAHSLTHLRRAERGPLPAERASLRPAAGRAPPAAAARPRRRPPCPCRLAEKFPKEAGAAPARGGGRSSPRPALPPGKAPRPGPPARRGSRLRRDGRSTAAAPAPLVLRSYFAAGRAGREGGAERASNPRSPALGTGNVGLRPAAPARA